MTVDGIYDKHLLTIISGEVLLTSSQASCYASLKLRLTDRLTDLLTRVKCRATSVAKKCEMRALLTLLVSKKAGSQTEPLRPLLDKMSTNSGAVLQ